MGRVGAKLWTNGLIKSYLTPLVERVFRLSQRLSIRLTGVMSIYICGNVHLLVCPTHEFIAHECDVTLNLYHICTHVNGDVYGAVQMQFDTCRLATQGFESQDRM